MKLLAVISEITWGISISKKYKLALLKVVIDRKYSIYPEVILVSNIKGKNRLKVGDRITLILDTHGIYKKVYFTQSITPKN